MNIASLIQGISVLAWIIVVGLLVVIVMRASRGLQSKNMIPPLITVVVVSIVITSVSAGLVYVRPEERGVVLSAFSPKGVRDQALTPGLKWVIPFAESVIMYPISRQTYTMSVSPKEGSVQGDDSITARTLDGQEIFVDASVIYAIDPEKVVQVHINWQNRYSDDLVRAQSRGIIRDAVSQYRVEEVISSKRFDVTGQVRAGMEKKLAENGLILLDFVLRNITFSPEYAASVEQKQISEQQAQQAKFVVETKKQEAEQMRQTAQGKADAAVIEAQGAAKARVIEADAETQALNKINEALKGNPNLLTYQYINKLAPTIQTMLLPSNSPFVFPLPTTGTGTTAVPQTNP